VGEPPAQKLPSAVLIYPLIRVTATQDTRIEMMNLTGASVSVECFYVQSGTCDEIGFFLSLTPSQPIAWTASTGSDGNHGRVAPPILGDGELKCVVMPSGPDLSQHNALQGRALVSGPNAQTIGYNAIAFRRLSPGDFTGVVSLDGGTYEQCPDRLHFQALSSQSGSDSELILVPCSENLESQIPSTAIIQLAVVNEFEQVFSGSTTVKCFDRRNFSSISALRRSATGTITMHVVVRGVDVPVVGLVIDRFTVPGSNPSAQSVSSNEPYLDGGRPAEIDLP